MICEGVERQRKGKEEGSKGVHWRRTRERERRARENLRRDREPKGDECKVEN